MIKGNDKPFTAGRPFKFLGDMSKEEKRNETKSTERCIECGSVKRSKHFPKGSLICWDCDSLALINEQN